MGLSSVVRTSFRSCERFPTKLSTRKPVLSALFNHFVALRLQRERARRRVAKKKIPLRLLRIDGKPHVGTVSAVGAGGLEVATQ
eukprot:2942840-Amphidinium_carterae.1